MQYDIYFSATNISIVIHLLLIDSFRDLSAVSLEKLRTLSLEIIEEPNSSFWSIHGGRIEIWNWMLNETNLLLVPSGPQQQCPRDIFMYPGHFW